MRLAKYVTFWVNGGLGNQLFQYAAGRAVAAQLGAELILDVNAYHGAITRPLLLPAFKTACRFDWNDRRSLPSASVMERQGTLNSEIFQKAPGHYFKGYWQNEDYFADFAPQLREELRFVDPPAGANLSLLQKIQSTNAVAVHVRRGDYVRDRNEAAIFATCSPAYYQRGAAALAERGVQNPVYFLFSDEPDWARAHIRLPGPSVIVNINTDATSFEDLRLMAACQHHIIANSTFSWWGAWLNESASKIVVAPRTWYLSKLSNASINAKTFTVIENIAD